MNPSTTEKKESDKFWKEIVYTKGKLDEKKVFNELSDYYYLLEQVPKVYMAVTGGMLSKPLYSAETIITQFEDHNYDKGIIQEDIKDLIKSCSDFEELKKELEDYFNL